MDPITTAALDALMLESIEDLKNRPLHEEETTTAINNFVNLSKTLPPEPEPVADSTPVPETRWGRFKLGVSNAWDNETTRTVIKVAGPLASVALVGSMTIKRDHVLERQAMDQTHQPPVR